MVRLEGGRDSSVWWKILCRIHEGVGEGVGNWFDDNIRRVIGHGRDTLFWYDKWIGDMLLRLKFPRLFDLATTNTNSTKLYYYTLINITLQRIRRKDVKGCFQPSRETCNQRRYHL